MTAAITYHFRAGLMSSAHLVRFGRSLNDGDSRTVLSPVPSVPGQLWERLAEADKQMHGKPRLLTYSRMWVRGPQLVHGGWPETWRRYVDGVLESRRPAMRARRA